MTLDRFTVREVNTWDAIDLLALLGDANIVRWMGVSQLRSLDEATALIERYQKSPTRWLSVREGPKFLGIVGLEIQGHHAAITIAFNAVRPGVGREFSTPFMQWVFTHPQVWRVSAYCHIDNVPVQRVLRRMGAECEGRLRRFAYFPNVSTEPQDVFLYAITR